MIPTVQKTVATRFPQIRGKRVLVAASGGADSTALVLALQELGCKPALAHVHHGIRGPAAAADARFVAALAKKLGAPFFLGKFNVPAEARKTGESLEMAARRLRRGFLVQAAKCEKIRFIATGHTADDQAETVLLRIARGTSVAGLAGIPYVANQAGVTFVRPLRDVTRQEITVFLKSRKQTWREDATNADDFALRNRVRHEILPLLEKRLNPAVRPALRRLAEIAAAEDEVLSALARKTRVTAKTPAALRRRAALAALRGQGKSPDEIDFGAVDGFFHRVEKPAKVFPLCGKAGETFSIVWKNPGNFSTVWKKVFHSVEKPRAAIELNLSHGTGFSRRADEVCLSAAAVGGRDLVFRTWRAGDRMKPLGMTGSKKLSDIFTDLKVPRAERGARIVVECGGEIAALAGWRVARDFAVEGPRAESLRIRLQPMTPRARSS